MPAAEPDIAARHCLTEAEADRLWRWLLDRQGLGASRRYTDVPQIAEAALGLHAARLPSPYATVLARAHSPDVAMRLWHPHTHRAVTTIRCMRKTLHTLPLDLAAAAHAATLHYRERDALRQVINAGLTDRMIRRTTTAIEALLSEAGHLPHRTIEERLCGGGTPVVAVRLALKLAWERGLVTYRNRSAGWNREQRTFALTSTAHPDLDLSLDRPTGTARLVEAYLDRYGPASLRDVAWWAGFSRSAILAALDSGNRPLVALHAPWTTATLYIYRDRFEQFSRDGHEEPSDEAHFLAHEDVALKAYAETRSRYLGNVAERAAFNQIGEALPTIVVAGKVVGIWRWNQPERAVSCIVFRGRVTSAIRAGIRRTARRVTAGLRMGYDGSAPVTGTMSSIRRLPGPVASSAPRHLNEVR
ncbi:DNA glycosylase AlkZ-like family protein [Solwaraspora sp. WMMB335]|uniref:DNA glycosylase AlkZ-like family protein n=1 Tax=Solwaraspora sp. WMMB335 TaxID=3404118 RepID=UPI003B9564E2